MLFKRNKGKIHFSGRKHSVLGIIATIIAVLVIAGFLAISFISGVNHGNGGFILGIVGLILFIAAVAGFILAYRSFRKKDIFYIFPIVGIALNGLMIIVLFIIYMVGI